MHTLALIYLLVVSASLLPGSAYIRKPAINWDGPHVYFALIATGCGVALSILVLTS